MEAITYSLRVPGPGSGAYYRAVADFTESVCAAAEEKVGPLLERFTAFLQAGDCEALRTRPEYSFELLCLGVYWQLYAAPADRLSAPARRLLAGLSRWRERSPRLQPLLDRGRGWLGGYFLHIPIDHTAAGAARAVAVPIDLARLERLLGWLEATGNYGEAVTRLLAWQEYWRNQPPAAFPADLAAVLALADWFTAASLEALGIYTANVERFLAESHPAYRGRYDAHFCGRRRVEYHLNMVGTEILNRAFRADFLRAGRKVVIVPPCMRARPEGECRAQPTPFGARCAACTPACRVHQVTQLGKKHGFEVFIIPDELSIFSKQGDAGSAGLKGGDLGVLGVSCVLTNAPGGWQMRKLGVPAQGLPLDFCGCSYHWHPEGIPTDIDFQELSRVLEV
jgi:hypothetical protein